MSVNVLLNTALSGLQTNQSALSQVSNNIANVNSPGYARRVVEQEPLSTGGQVNGVAIADTRRAVDTYLSTESVKAAGDAARFEAEARIHDRIQAMFGAPDDPSGLSGRVNTALGAASHVVADPADPARRASYLADIEEMARSFSTMADQVQAIRGDTDAEIKVLVSDANRLIDQVDDLNRQIQALLFSGKDHGALSDQRDVALTELGELIDITVREQGDGGVNVTTSSGFPLVGPGKTSLSYENPGVVTGDTVFPGIIASRTGSTGAPMGTPQALDPHIRGGALRGLLTMRDESLPGLASQIGELAGVVTDRLNALHNDNASVPAPTTLTGRQTGLEPTDALSFTGRTAMAVVDSAGDLVGRVDIDFTAGTYSVNGGAAQALGGTVGAMAASLDTALDTTLGANGTVAFTNGVLSVDTGATGHGVAFLQDTADPSARAGRGFSHFFGLNDLMRGHQPAHGDTGLSGTDAHGFTPGQTMDLELRHADGTVARTMTLTVPAGNVNAILTELNDPTTGLGGVATFSLDAKGHLKATPAPAYGNYAVKVTSDNTSRATSGVSFSDLFALGGGQQMERARDLAVVSEVKSDPGRLAFARLDLSGASVPGDTVLTKGDNRGAQALQGLATAHVAFGDAGATKATTTTIAGYGGLIAADNAGRAAMVDARVASASALREEVDARKAEVQGVNLDEELSNMITYQQAYNASARVLTAAQQMYDTLLQMV